MKQRNFKRTNIIFTLLMVLIFSLFMPINIFASDSLARVEFITDDKGTADTSDDEVTAYLLIDFGEFEAGGEVYRFALIKYAPNKEGEKDITDTLGLPGDMKGPDGTPPPIKLSEDTLTEIIQSIPDPDKREEIAETLSEPEPILEPEPMVEPLLEPEPMVEPMIEPEPMVEPMIEPEPEPILLVSYETALNIPVVSGQNVNISWNPVAGVDFILKRRIAGSSWKTIVNGVQNIIDYDDDLTSESYYGPQSVDYELTYIDPDGLGYAYQDSTTVEFPQPIIDYSISNVNVSNSGTITWLANANPTRFEIYKRIGSNGNYVHLVSVNTAAHTDSPSSYENQLSIGDNEIQYRIDVIAEGIVKHTELSNIINIVKLDYTPSVNTVVHTSGGDNVGANISWNAVIGATGYKIYKSVDGGSNYTEITEYNGTDTNYIDTNNFIAGNTYNLTYKVDVYASGINKANSTAILSGLTIPNYTIANVQVTEGGIITWNKNDNPDSFKIYRKIGSGSFELIASVTAANYTDLSSVYDDKLNVGNNDVQYRVDAIRSEIVKDTKLSNTLNVVKIDYTPTITSITEIAGTGFTINWQKVAGTNSFNIKRKIDGIDSDYKVISTGISGSTITYNDDGIDFGSEAGTKVVNYIVIGVGSNNSEFPSTSSNNSLVYTPTHMPKNFTAEATVNGVKLTWGAIDGITSFALKRSDPVVSGGYYYDVNSATALSGTTREFTDVLTNYADDGIRNLTYKIISKMSGQSDKETTATVAIDLKGSDMFKPTILLAENKGDPNITGEYPYFEIIFKANTKAAGGYYYTVSGDNGFNQGESSRTPSDVTKSSLSAELQALVSDDEYIGKITYGLPNGGWNPNMGWDATYTYSLKAQYIGAGWTKTNPVSTNIVVPEKSYDYSMTYKDAFRNGVYGSRAAGVEPPILTKWNTNIEGRAAADGYNITYTDKGPWGGGTDPGESHTGKSATVYIRYVNGKLERVNPSNFSQVLSSYTVYTWDSGDVQYTTQSGELWVYKQDQTYSPNNDYYRRYRTYDIKIEAIKNGEVKSEMIQTGVQIQIYYP